MLYDENATFNSPSTSNASQETETISSNQSSLISSSKIQTHFDLNSCLQKDIVGQAILAKSTSSTLTNSDRDRLAELVMKYLLNKYGSLVNDDLHFVASEIERLLPGEKSSTYFIESIKKRNSLRNISERARGKLVDKQRNLLYMIRKLAAKEHQENLGNCSSPVEKGKLTLIGISIIETAANDLELLLHTNYQRWKKYR